jgi:dipeptidyl aminopeptidase/acylaminoacyl peptidase
VTYTTGKTEYRFFDERRERIQRFLDERLPDHENRLASHSRDERRYVVHSGGDRTRGSYWLLDVPENSPGESPGEPRLERLFDSAPWLVEEELAEVRPIQYTSRDGLTIHGYLTLPVGREPRNLPLVVNPHGGPWHRDVWGFDPEVQFLASRGLAVLHMNFRGSVGYGRAFWEASFRQWGLAMQDDVTDGVRWAIEQGIADPKRVAIYGGSYGGYASLAGITKTPDLYACAISYVGVSNLFTWIEAFPPYWKPFLEMIHEMVGHPERDAEQWRATSPLFQADKIRVPLLVVQGAQDPRVKKEESDQIVAALRERGVPVEYLLKENEGHGFSNEENQFDFYRALEAFLTEHLGLADSGTDS